MKLTHKIAILLAALLVLGLCAAVSADVIADDPVTAAPTESTAAGTTSTSARQIVLVPYDEEGNLVGSSGLMGCVGGTTLYIKHTYKLVVCYYEQATSKIIETDDKLLLGVECDSPYLTYSGNVINLASADKAYNFTCRVADPSEEAGQVNYTVSVNRFNFSIIEFLIAAVGLYLIVTAIRGKGSTFSDEYIKEEKKPLFRRLALLLGILAGLVLIASGIIAICFSYCDWSAIARYICLGTALALLIAMAVVNSVMTDREKRDKADKQKMGGSGSSAAAFEFDGTEPTLDEVLESIEQEKKDPEA